MSVIVSESKKLNSVLFVAEKECDTVIIKVKFILHYLFWQSEFKLSDNLDELSAGTYHIADGW